MALEFDGVNNIIKTNTINEVSSGNGVSIDGLTIKDGGITSTTGTTVFNEDSASVNFRVESDGSANMLFVDGTNNKVGINTSSPDRQLQVEDTIANGGATIGLQTSDSSTSGTCGIIHFGNNTDSSIASINGLADGSTSAGALLFKTEVDGGSIEERMRIRSNGIVLIGTTSATNGQIEIKSTTTNAIKGYFANSTANFSNIRSFSDVGGTETETLRVENDGDVKNINNSYGSLSDERIKQDITDASSQWEDIKALKVKNYRRKNHVQVGLDYKMIGVIAQDLEEAGMSGLVKESIPSTGEIRANEIFGTIEEKQIYYNVDDPEVQNGEKTTNDVKDTVLEEKPSGETVKSVKYSVLYMKAIKALQEAMTRIEELETKVEALENA